MPQLGPAEILVVLVIALMVFGPKRLPEVGRKYAKKFVKTELFTIDDVFGGWKKAGATHFVDGAFFDQIYVDEKVKNYIVDIVFATREPENYNLKDLKPLIAYGASPRATIYLTLAAKAYAFLQGRGYVTPEDVKLIGVDVLRHRVLLSYEAEAEEMTSEDIVKQIFDGVEVP